METLSKLIAGYHTENSTMERWIRITLPAPATFLRKGGALMLMHLEKVSGTEGYGKRFLYFVTYLHKTNIWNTICRLCNKTTPTPNAY